MQLSPEQKYRLRRISLTPLIDVVFLLLIFFMLSSTFLKFVNVPVSGGKLAGGATLEKAELAITSVTADGSINVNGEQVELEGLAERLDALDKKGRKRAVIQPREGVKVQTIVSVLQQARRSKLQNILLAR